MNPPQVCKTECSKCNPDNPSVCEEYFWCKRRDKHWWDGLYEIPNSWWDYCSPRTWDGLAENEKHLEVETVFLISLKCFLDIE